MINTCCPKLVHFTCGQNPSMRQREKVVPLAEGRVLEIGIGSGLNIPFYDAQKVTHLWGLDPSGEMWSIAQKNAAKHHLDAEFIQSGAESIPLDNNSADTVLMTYTMCTIPDVHAALDEVRRVLKPGGKLDILRTRYSTGRKCSSAGKTGSTRSGKNWRVVATLTALFPACLSSPVSNPAICRPCTCPAGNQPLLITGVPPR